MMQCKYCHSKNVKKIELKPGERQYNFIEILCLVWMINWRKDNEHL